MKGIAQLYVANIVQDADTQFVFGIKKNFLNFYTWYKMWQLSFISPLLSFVNRNCSNFYVLNTTSNAINSEATEISNSR